MSRGGKGVKRKFHFKNIRPTDPNLRRWGDWLSENRSFYEHFREWLFDAGYSRISVALYGVAARQAIGYLDKPFWVIDPDADLEKVWQYLGTRPLTDNTRSDYHKGLLKLGEYLRHRLNKPPKEKEIRWEYHLGTLPDWLVEDIRSYVQHSQRNWKPDRRHEKTVVTISAISRSLRWMHTQHPILTPADLTPERWYEYMDHRLSGGITTSTLNHELLYLQRFLTFIADNGKTVCQRMFLLDELDEARRLPRDVPPEMLLRLQKTIQAQAAINHRERSRLAKMDLAWFLLMLHSGLRTCEVRSLRLGDIDWERQRARIENSKGMKDRIVFLSQPTITALKAYLEVRGPAEALPEFVFIYRHKPLSRFYCGGRLHTYGQKCNVHIIPHALRHSCATLLLNSGAPVLSVQTLLGHRWVDTTLGYARLYDGTVAADYYLAMAGVERRLALPEDRLAEPPGIGQLLALVDALCVGTLNNTQSETVRQLRLGIMALAEREKAIQDVKVPGPGS